MEEVENTPSPEATPAKKPGAYRDKKGQKVITVNFLQVKN